MDCDINRQKRSCEEIFSPSKQHRLEEPSFNESSNTRINELQSQNLGFSDALNKNGEFTCTLKSSFDMDPSNNLQVTEPTTNHSTPIPDTCEITFSDSSCDFMSAKDYLNTFFKELECSYTTTEDLVDQEPVSSISEDCITPPTMVESINPIPRTKGSSKSFLFQKELSDLIYLSLRFYNKRYHIQIREIKRSVFTNEEIPSKNGTNLDIDSWYEFQYKIFAFNLKYKSSSFVANNTILVLNCNNSIMQIKNLKNYTSVELSDYQLEKLKDVAYDLNEKLIRHMYDKHLPKLIKKKCTLSNVSLENELILMTKLIEKSVLSILNRIYECNACKFSIHSTSIHQCFMFNNREKFQQLGDMILMLVDIDFIASMFSNEVNTISKHFLSLINLDTIKNGLFKT